jgi:asparagine synthase (glutamine-hydrolysing)
MTCRAKLLSAVAAIGERTEEKSRVLILSGGVDTCAILAAAGEVGVTFQAGITVVTSEDSPDRAFAAAAAAEKGLAHHVICVTAEDLLEQYLPKCVSLLNTFDGMTLRNSLVIAATMQKVRDLGYSHAVVGDGADELFGGYSFMWGCENDEAEWKEKRDKICAKWTFATEAIARSYGIQVSSPYMDPAFVEWAVNNTARPDCIGQRGIRLVYGGETIDHITGKVCLREAFDTVSSWRRKDPIEVGSGMTIISHDAFWADRISDETFAAEQKQLLVRGFAIKNKEHLANFRAFECAFGENGCNLPTKARREIGQGCVDCCFEIADATFCDVCGAYPAQRSTCPK